MSISRGMAKADVVHNYYNLTNIFLECSLSIHTLYGLLFFFFSQQFVMSSFLWQNTVYFKRSITFQGRVSYFQFLIIYAYGAAMKSYTLTLHFPQMWLSPYAEDTSEGFLDKVIFWKEKTQGQKDFSSVTKRV